MLTFEQIEDSAAEYKSLSLDDLDGLETEALHQLLQQRVVTEREVTITKKSLTGSANDLLKKIKADVDAVSAELQRREERSLPNPSLALEGAS